MKTKLLSITIFVVLLSGCTTAVVNYQPESTSVSEPVLNTVVEKNIGDELIKYGKYMEQDGIRVTTAIPLDVRIDGGRSIGVPYVIHPGNFYKIGEDKNADYYRIGGGGDGFGFVERGTFSDPAESLMVNRNGNIICIITIYSYYVCKDSATVGVEKIKQKTVAPNSVLQALVYNGKSNNKIKIGYREYAGDTTRSSSSNDVEYDVSNSLKISYKGAVLEVLEVKDQTIKYRVLSNFSRSEK